MQVQVSFEQQHGGKLGQVVLICLQQHQSWGQKGSGGERLYFPLSQKSMLTVWGNVNRQYTALQGEGICTCLKSGKVQWPCFSTWELAVLYDKIKMAAASGYAPILCWPCERESIPDCLPLKTTKTLQRDAEGLGFLKSVPPHLSTNSQGRVQMVFLDISRGRRENPVLACLAEVTMEFLLQMSMLFIILRLPHRLGYW